MHGAQSHGVHIQEVTHHHHLQVPGPSKALSMGNVKAVYRADTPLARTPATPMPQRPPLFAALLPCCYAPPTTPTVTGRGGAQGVHMRGDDVRGDDGADGELVNQVASGMLAEGDDKGVFTSHANSTLMAHPLEDDDDDDDVDDHSTRYASWLFCTNAHYQQVFYT